MLDRMRKLFASKVVAAGSVVAALLLSGGAQAEAPLRVGVLKFGTVNWELGVMQHYGLDRAEGVELSVLPLASKSATHVALQGGAADIIVTDWLWVSRQRAEGRRYVFVPYSNAVGGVLVRPDAGVARLDELRGKRIGVAGGPVDKSWLLLRAYARRQMGVDLLGEAEPNFAAPPLLNQLMLRGELPAVLTFWHYGARLKAAGMQELLSIREILDGLGVESDVPLIGWVFHEDWAVANGERLQAFLRASAGAKAKLADSDAEWERIRAQTKAEDDATLAALRDAYRAGLPGRLGDKQIEAARRVYAILAEIGGAELVGPSPELSPGTFWEGAR